ncbi:nucleoporin GLE1 SCDLUD_001929 [Saccharomycodes ludwigii]|uniref:nucleoporin GLE1 n=1 Tax=Saccharomycodes ludwigii TaxID=36035 RepID=UPI001E82F5E6|nr:hypothetical protein SCDLUD_001929 [Saccharomycodes ludwigii]KAH3902116.1 hypothetical protein SCDLUD_001929 [Saccharomycodes ludwigii]
MLRFSFNDLIDSVESEDDANNDELNIDPIVPTNITHLQLPDDSIDQELHSFLNKLKISENIIPVVNSIQYHNKYDNNRVRAFSNNTHNKLIGLKDHSFIINDNPHINNNIKYNITEPNDKIISSDFLSNIDRLKHSAAKNLQYIQLLKKKRKEEEEEKMREEQKQKKKEEEERKRKEEHEARIKKEQEEKRKLEEKANILKQKQLEEEAKHLKEQELLKKRNATKGVYNKNHIETVFIKYKKLITSIKEDIVIKVSKDKNLKTILSKHKRKINPKFGQLTNSIQQLNSVTNHIFELVDQTKNNELGFKWILNFIAKAIVSQAETEVAVKPEISALPLAKLTLNLLLRYPELKQFLLARFIKKCPLVIGYTCPIDTEEGRLRMGWKRVSSNDGVKWEDSSSYNERLGGIACLYVTITRLILPSNMIETAAHPLPIDLSWKMASRIANINDLALLTDVHFVVLNSFIDGCGTEFIQCYGNQGIKLMSLISTSLTSLVADKKLPAAARLRILWEQWETTGKLEGFPEMVQ